MKKFLKLGNVFAVLVLAMCLAGCNFNENSGVSSVELSGGINGYYILLNDNGHISYHTSGYLENTSNSKFSCSYTEKKEENSAVEFTISGNTFTLKKCNNNKTLHMNGGEEIYSKNNNGNFFVVGKIYITPVDKNYDIKFVPVDSE